jgi:transposase
VALASPGGDGLPLCALLERRGVAGRRVEPPQVPPIQGRPTRDGHAGPWRQRLLTLGLLAGACRPPAQVGVRRSSLRPRARFLPEASPHIPPRPKARTPMHRTRPHGVSEVTGATGMARRRAMLAGERDPVRWARRRHDRG